MAALHFQGRADAYLEWAVASGFVWVGNSQPGNGMVSLLVNDTTAVPHAIRCQQVSEHALRTGPLALPRGVWTELAQAVDDDQVLNGRHNTWSSSTCQHDAEAIAAPALLACIDSGIGTGWFQTWKQANPLRKVCHWDMDSQQPAMSAQSHSSHGAHVLSWLAGQPPYTGHPFDADTASQCPLILVNLPHDAVQDPTGRWLGRYILEGLDFAIQQALHTKTCRLVVNISWGPQTGPHDGSSLLELALAQRINAAQALGLRVDIVLAAGNSRENRAHAQFDAQLGCAELAWVVPPASKTPFFLELWWPSGTDIAQIQIEAMAPNGQTLSLRGQGVYTGHNACGVMLQHPQPHQASRPMALLALNPTGERHRAAAHGRWRLGVSGIRGALNKVQVYVARQTANLGGRYRGPDSYLDSPRHGQPPFHRHLHQAYGPPVTSEGSLSGLATAVHANIHVASGSVHSTVEPARYASEGPAVGGGLHRPDWALPTDETPGLRGILGAASRPGSVVRLVGTSMAAPQLARRLVNGPALVRGTSADPRIGHGVLSLGWTSRQRA